MQGNNGGKNYPALKKTSSWRIMLEKNLTPLYLRDLGKKILPKPNRPKPHLPSKVKWSTPKILYLTYLMWRGQLSCHRSLRFPFALHFMHLF